MKLVTIIGARPQFVKAAVISRAISDFNKLNKKNVINEVIIHTGQHYDENMSEIFFHEMKIPIPAFNLGIGGKTHGSMTGKMLEKIEEILITESPDLVMVYGDTNSTLAGALAASKLNIPIAHVEAGLRSFNMFMPEEVNRVLTDRISKFLFCPTDTAVSNLNNEGFPNRLSKNNVQFIVNTGDVMYDAALFYGEIAVSSTKINDLLKNMSEGFYLATIHRAENTDNVDRFKNIFLALDTIAKTTKVVIPLHPRTKRLMKLHNIKLDNIIIIEPVGYFDMITLLKNCIGVFTDSGGVQKEAFFFKKQCITLRDETEWVELVNNGFNYLVGTEFENIIHAEQKIASRKCDFTLQLYGDGKSGEKILNHLLK